MYYTAYYQSCYCSKAGYNRHTNKEFHTSFNGRVKVEVADRVVFTSEDYSLVVIFKRVFNRKVKTPCSVCHIDSTLFIVRDA